MDVAEELLLVADAAVGHEDDLPDLGAVVGPLERGAQGREHLGAAVRLEIPDPRLRLAHGLGKSAAALAVEPAHPVVELDDVEAVLGMEAVERERERPPGLVDGRPDHRTRRVDDEDRLARQPRAGHLGLVRRQHEEKREDLPVEVLGEDRGLRAVAEIGLPRELEIPVGREGLVRHGHGVARLADRRGLQRVRRAPERAQPHARVELHAQAHRVDARVARTVHGGRDAGGVADGDRVERPARAGSGFEKGRAGNVARRDDHRKTQMKLPLVVADRLLVFDRDRDVLVGTDRRDRRGENVGTLLFEERGFLPVRLRLFVDPFRLDTLADVRLDDALADREKHPVHGSALRERENIDAFDAVAGRVGEALPDRRARDDAGHADRDVRLERRRRKVHPGVIGRDEQAPGLHLVGAHGRAEIRRRLGLSVRRQPEEQQEPRGETGEGPRGALVSHDDTSMDRRPRRRGWDGAAPWNCRDELWRNCGGFLGFRPRRGILAA